MESLGSIGTIIGGIGGLAVAGFSGFFFARRRMSRDGVELVKDRSEINIIEQLEKQRADAIVERDSILAQKTILEQEKTALFDQLRDAKLQMEGLTEHVELLEDLTTRLQKALDNASKRIEVVARQAEEGSGK